MAYIRSWQDALNKAAAPNGLYAFRFNTYIIAALVIFFLQVKQKFPKMANVPMSSAKFIDHVPHIDRVGLKQTVGQFFEFYGSQYQMANHIISANIGEWQNRQINQQSNLTSEQERLLFISNTQFFSFSYKMFMVAIILDY